MIDFEALTDSLGRVALGLTLSFVAALATYVLGVGLLRLVVGAALAVVPA